MQPSTEAKEQFQLGVAMLQDPDGARYEGAFKAFLRAYTISPSWKILGNLGLSAMKLERYTDGIVAYERYLAEGGKKLDADERKQIERDLAVMKGASASLTLTVADGHEASIRDTRSSAVGGAIVNSYEVPSGGKLTLILVPGDHSLVVSKGELRKTLTLNVEGGARIEETISWEVAETKPAPLPKPAPERAASNVNEPTASGFDMRTTGLIVGGVGVLALIGGGVTALVGLQKKSAFDDRCPGKICAYETPAELASIESDKSSLETLATLTNGLLIGGGVLAAAGATLFLVGGPESQEQVSVRPGLATLSVRGNF